MNDNDKTNDVNDDPNKTPYFMWTDDLVAEVSKRIYDDRCKSPVWTSDNTAELNIIKDFKLWKVINEKMEDFIVSETENQLTVKKDKFRELLKFLTTFHNNL